VGEQRHRAVPRDDPRYAGADERLGARRAGGLGCGFLECRRVRVHRAVAGRRRGGHGAGRAPRGATWLLVAARVFFFAFAGIFVFGALQIAGGPAEVSTQADDLKERLNDVRVSDFSREADEKVAIIERALSNANHGQGVGFQVVGTVIDQRKLQQIGMRLVAGAQVFVPLVLAFSNVCPLQNSAIVLGYAGRS
jgi:hypothetical protein